MLTIASLWLQRNLGSVLESKSCGNQAVKLEVSRKGVWHTQDRQWNRRVGAECRMCGREMLPTLAIG